MKKDNMMEEFGHFFSTAESMGEWLTLQATEALCEMLNDAQMSRKELADKMGVRKSYITQLLSGSRNMTLQTLATVAYHCGRAIRMSSVPVKEAYNLQTRSINPYFSFSLEEAASAPAQHAEPGSSGLRPVAGK